MFIETNKKMNFLFSLPSTNLLYPLYPTKNLCGSPFIVGYICLRMYSGLFIPFKLFKGVIQFSSVLYALRCSQGDQVFCFLKLIIFWAENYRQSESSSF